MATVAMAARVFHDGTHNGVADHHDRLPHSDADCEGRCHRVFPAGADHFGSVQFGSKGSEFQKTPTKGAIEMAS
jgi:hypothetical protein